MKNNMTLEELKKLTDELSIASDLYYNKNGIGNIMSDEEYDLKFKELQKAEKILGKVFPNSPSLRVGTDALKEFGKIKHPYPMLTIENTYNDTELQFWIDKINEKYLCNYNISVKYDGISCELHYENGYLKSASTRGDKNYGDDITFNVRTIKSVPLYINEESLKDKDFYVRGEILLPKSRLNVINEERITNGEEPFSNTRNACSGSVKQLDSKITAKRGLIFRAWDCFFDDETVFETMEAKYLFLDSIGFEYEIGTLPMWTNCLNVVSDINSFKEKIDKLNLDYDYDGVVIKIDECHIQNEIGTKDTRAIEWGIARKWNEEYQVKTFLCDVDWQIGRTGVLTPVAKVEPVECGGVIIRNITLHNIDFIEKYDLHIGNTLLVTRSGGVIPYIYGVEHDLLMELNGIYKRIKAPEICPICGGTVIKDGALLKCTNEECSSKDIGKIIQFCSKDCMDIKNVGEKVVEDLYNFDIVKNVNDIVALGGGSTSMREKFNKLKDIEGYGEKSMANIIKGLEESFEKQPWERVLGSLSIPNVGKVTARILSKKYKTIHEFKECTVEELINIEGIAEITATGIYEWIQSHKNLLYDIEYWGLNCMDDEVFSVEEQIKPLEGLNVVFSGSSSKFKSDEVESFLENKGAKCGHSISKKTDYLIIGEKPGPSKVQKAKELGVEVIEENEFYNKFKI